MSWATKERSYTERTVRINKGQYKIVERTIGGQSTTKVYTKGKAGVHEVKDQDWKENVLKSA